MMGFVYRIKWTKDALRIPALGPHTRSSELHMLCQFITTIILEIYKACKVSGLKLSGGLTVA